MQIRILLFLILSAVLNVVQAQTPNLQGTPDTNLQQQLSDIEQKINELQKQFSELSQQKTPGDTSRKIIIIDGKNIVISDEQLEKSLNELSKDSLILGKGLKIYQSGDSVLITLGGMKIQLRDSDDSDNVVINEEQKQEKNKNTDSGKTVKTQVFSLRLGFNNYLFNNRVNHIPAYPDLELNNAKSLNIGIGIVNVRMNLIKHLLRFNVGLLYDVNNYRFSTDATLIPRIDSVAFQPKEINANVSKNKLTTGYLMLPMNFQFSSSAKSSHAFKLSAGFRVGYRIDAHTKQVVNNKKEKDRDDYNLNSLKYGLSASIGYSWLNLYADYDMSTMFREGVQPLLTPFQVGIVLAGF